MAGRRRLDCWNQCKHRTKEERERERLTDTHIRGSLIFLSLNIAFSSSAPLIIVYLSVVILS